MRRIQEDGKKIESRLEAFHKNTAGRILVIHEKEDGTARLEKDEHSKTAQGLHPKCEESSQQIHELTIQVQNICSTMNDKVEELRKSQEQIKSFEEQIQSLEVRWSEMSTQLRGVLDAATAVRKAFAMEWESFEMESQSNSTVPQLHTKEVTTERCHVLSAADVFPQAASQVQSIQLAPVGFQLTSGKFCES